MILASIRCRPRMRLLAIAVAFLPVVVSVAQSNSVPSAKAPVLPSAIALRESSRKNIVSEMGGAFMGSPKCDSDGNLYIRKYASDRPLLSPVAKIDSEGKRSALFDPVAVSQLDLIRADAFSPSSDGGL